MTLKLCFGCSVALVPMFSPLARVVKSPRHPRRSIGCFRDCLRPNLWRRSASPHIPCTFSCKNPTELFFGCILGSSSWTPTRPIMALPRISPVSDIIVQETYEGTVRIPRFLRPNLGLVYPLHSQGPPLTSGKFETCTSWPKSQVRAARTCLTLKP